MRSRWKQNGWQKLHLMMKWNKINKPSVDVCFFVFTHTMSTIPSERVISLPDSSLYGVSIWISLLSIFGVFSILLFEYLRKHPSYINVYYTRLSKSTSGKISHPNNRFGWIFQVFMVPEVLMLEEIGLDAVMYLRFLAMSFKIFSIIMVILFVILIPVNYVAASEQQTALNITLEAGTVYEVTNSALSAISVSRIQNGSNLLWVHCVCSYLVSGVVYYFLYHEYQSYVSTASKCLREPQDRLDKLKQRTILITNLPRSLRTKLALEKWLIGIDLGTVVSIYMNTKQDEELLKYIQQYKDLIYNLERAYMQWCVDIYKLIHFPHSKSVVRLGSSQRIKLIETQMSEDEWKKASVIANNCRPLYMQTVSKTRDVIKTLRKRIIGLDSIIGKMRLERRELVSVTTQELVSVTNPEPDDTIDVMYSKFNSSSTSAFITFKSPRSAYTALQMKLDSSMDGFSMQVKPAPLPNDVLWNNLTKSLWDRKVKRAALSILSMGFCAGWVIPTFYISTIAYMVTPEWTEANPFFAMIVTTVLPPVLILICAVNIPYLLDCT
jgi:RNA recognition motif-containing protein